MTLTTPIEEIPRVGPYSQKKLKKLGVRTVGDLLFHFPHRYEDFSNLIPIDLANNEIGKIICVQGKLTAIKNIRIFKRRLVITEALLQDKTGTLRVTWFNQPYLINTFKSGDFLFLAGKMTSKNGKSYLSSPSYEKIPSPTKDVKNEINPNFDLTHIGRLVPIYPETEGISSRWLRFIIKPILVKLKKEIPEILPEKIRKENNLLEIKKAIWQIHFPDSLEQAELAKKRFVFEELFNLALVMLKEKIKLAEEKATIIFLNLDLIKKFVNSLPFKLTDDQKKSAWQILKDLEKPKPMNRLLDGDVGSGKTVVAAMALLNTIKSGFQVAFMAPTEILAKQHFKTLTNLSKGFRIRIGLITGKENYFDGKKTKRKELIEKVKEEAIDLLIGTHALVEEKVKFKKLGLVIIDEQHRFGIEQRAKLCQKQSFTPHFLSMSATPIPRTLALTVYGDLDLSLIKELPKGRKKIITRIIRSEEKEKTYQFIRKEIKKGCQVFVVCPRIEPYSTRAIAKTKEPSRFLTPPNGVVGEEEALASSPVKISEKQQSWAEVKAVKEEYEKLRKDIFPDLKIAMLHGKMKTEEKESVLKSFKDKKTDILVSTSVIEVGIDFPNATIMMIEGAEKFGLAQLHQFRGRVGRGQYQSYCLLFTDFPTNPRLRAMTRIEDGFTLAEKDLKLRGPGDLTGQRQWGLPDFIMASLGEIGLVEKTRNAAKELLQQDPELKNHPFLRNKLTEFRKRIHLE